MAEHKHLTQQQLDDIRSRCERFDKAVGGSCDGEAAEAAYACALDVPPLLAEVDALRAQLAPVEEDRKLIDLPAIRMRVNRDMVVPDDVLALIAEVAWQEARIAGLRLEQALERQRREYLQAGIARLVDEIPTGELRGRLSEMARDVLRQADALIGEGGGTDE